MGTVGNPNRRNARIWTALNTSGGASSIFINWGIATNARVHVLEYSGIKASGAVESVWNYNNFAVGTNPGPIAQGFVTWNVAYSLLLSVNSNNSTNTEVNNGVNAPTPPWTLVSANRATYGGSLSEKIPTYTHPSLPAEGQGLIGNATQQCWAAIVILKADLSVTCSETLDTDDTDTMDVSLNLPMDTFTLSDLVDALLNGNERFRSNSEMLTTSDIILFLSTFVRVFQETTLLLDSLTFMNQFVRTLAMETIRIQDWCSVKKTNSTRWGS